MKQGKMWLLMYAVAFILTAFQVWGIYYVIATIFSKEGAKEIGAAYKELKEGFQEGIK